MRVVVPQELFEAGRLKITELDDLMREAVRKEHTLLLDPAWNASADEPVNHWLRSREAVYRDAWRGILDVGVDEGNGIIRGALQIRVSSGGTSRWDRQELTVSDAVELMRTPLQLYLEHDHADYEFLLRIASSPHGRREGLKAARSAARMQVKNGGGNTSMKSHIARVAAATKDGTDPDRLRHAWIEVHRLWVMFDKDANRGDAKGRVGDATIESDESKALREAGENLGLPMVQTCRRSIENYLPEAALRRWADQAGESERAARALRVESLFSAAFGELRRAAISMKEGLAKDRQGGVLPHPFQDLDEGIAGALEQGFSKNIAKYYQSEQLPDAAFHQVFESDPVAGEWREALFSSLFGRL